MNLQKILVPIGGVVLVAAAYRAWGWGGVAIASGGVLMWVLLHFTRMVNVLRRAADQPIGHVASAVMLNARLKPGMTLLHVIAMTRALGELQSPRDTQPEIYRWTDAGASHVTAEFRNGKLAVWQLYRPPQDAPDATTSAAPDAAPPDAPGQ